MMMNPVTHSNRNHSSIPVPMLRWVFQRHANMLTCELAAGTGPYFDVSIVPHWNLAASVIERFEASMPAFERHADIALRLREAGWSLVDRVPAANPDRRGGSRAAA